MEIDVKTPLYPGCQPKDTRLQVTLDALEMKLGNKWTDASFNQNMQFFHEHLPEGNTLPTSIKEAKKVVCPLDLPHVKYHACIMIAQFIGASTRIEPHVRCVAKDGTRNVGRKFLEKWYGAFLSLPVVSKPSSCNGMQKGRSLKKIRRRVGSLHTLHC